MQVFFLKSLLSLGVAALVFVALFTMFEVFGRAEKRFNVERLKRIHRLNGLVFVALSSAVAYLCLDYLLKTRAEPSPRATFHAVFSLSVFLLLLLKISYVRFYRQFYGQVKVLGLLVALLSVGMIGTSGGYYLLVTKFGMEQPAGLPGKSEDEAPGKESEKAVMTDTGSIAKGKALYEDKCYFCHDAHGTGTIVGPGHKGILKNPLLPVSRRPATPENVAKQIRDPVKDMPSFSYLSEEEVDALVAYLNTL